MYNDLKTLTGMNIQELVVKLDEQMPSDAYKPVPGALGLTDIDPSYMRKYLNECFGLCGIGWGYDYSANDLILQADPEAENKNERFSAYLTRGMFWYMMVSPDGTIVKHQIPASGGSTNRSYTYAMKGAITSFLGNAVSQIGFQESVYLNKRSHNLANQSSTKVEQTAKKETRKHNGGDDSKVEEKKTVKVEEIAVTEERLNAAKAYVIPQGIPLAGQTLGTAINDAFGRDVVKFLAGERTNKAGKKFEPSSTQEKQLQAAARFLYLNLVAKAN